MKKKSLSNNFDQWQLAEIEALLLDRIEEFLDFLNIEYQCRHRRIDMACPVHGGDNITAVNLYLTGHTRAGHWVCNTHHCEKFFKPTLIGFVRGILSHRQFDWCEEGDKYTHFPKAVQFILDFLNKDYDEINVDYQDIEKRRFESKINSIFKEKEEKKQNKFIPRTKVKSSLQIPCQYYIDRGYSARVLSEYDVGTSMRQGSPMQGRAVVPIYEETGKYMVGCSGRALNDNMKPKWMHSSGFDADRYLYNYWNAKKYIEETSCAILVEGPGDVWKLEDNGIHNSVAMFGTYLSESQKDLLDILGTMSLIVITDNDNAGKIGAESIMKQCGKTYRLFFPKLSRGDVGEMESDVITSEIKPIIESAVSSLQV
mgnify:FL=1